MSEPTPVPQRPAGLGAALRRLSKLLGCGSGRIRVQIQPGSIGIPRLEEVQIVLAGRLERVCHLKGDDIALGIVGRPSAVEYVRLTVLGLIEQVLRAEIDARGMFWQLRPVAYDPDGPYRAMVSDWDRLQWEVTAASPTEALAWALVRALEEPRG